MARTISRSAPAPGAQGTLGGVATPTGSRPGRRQMTLDDGTYMWILVILEAGAIAMLRSIFSRYHGG
jgi:hypothetical protein